MIKKSDYLKSYKRMNENERIEYLANVDRWTDETYPRLAYTIVMVVLLIASTKKR